MNLVQFIETQPDNLSRSQCLELSRDLTSPSATIPAEFKQDIQFLLSVILTSGGNTSEDVKALSKLLDSF